MGWAGGRGRNSEGGVSVGATAVVLDIGEGATIYVLDFENLS